MILIAQTIAYIAATKVSVFTVPVASLWLLIAGCLLVGFLTPVVAALIGIGGISFALLGLPLPVQYFFDSTQTLLDVIVLATVIFLLGPGAFSIDAKMFGRREIRIPVVSNPVAK